MLQRLEMVGLRECDHFIYLLIHSMNIEHLLRSSYCFNCWGPSHEQSSWKILAFIELMF